MRTFSLDVGFTATITAPDEFLSAWREEAKNPEASPFLKEIQKQHPEDDDAFLLAILKNGVRIRIAEALQHLCATDGLGLRLAPATVKGAPKLPPPEDAVPVHPSDVQ